MDQQLDARGLAAARLAGLRSRVARLRRRGIAFAAATFALAWGLIFVRMVSGHDPVLGDGASPVDKADASRDQSGQAGSAGSPQTSQRLIRVPLASGGYGYMVVPAGQAGGESPSAPAQPAPAPSPTITRTS